jgi:fatty-acyl-CoA synthase
LQHPNIKDVAVVGVADEEWGGRLRAYVVTQKRSRLTEQAVKQHVKARLARHKVPRDVVFVDEIPRSSTGKVAKAQLQSGGE